ncbi:MAG TPA: hypothetical protein PKO06_06425 [Candidatus Ozemobacteraceae bacterium]|nr:hypothetical protein [Candidatus Ozemobacteraceae bacterium]
MNPVSSYLFFDASFPTAMGQIGTPEKYQSFSWETRQDLAAHQTRYVDRMLSSCDTTFEQIARIGVGVGPGSLTGLRMTVGFFRTLAMYGGKPLLGVSLFDWAAKTLERQGRSGTFRLALPGPLKGQFVTEVSIPGGGPIAQAQIRFFSAEAFRELPEVMVIRQHVPNCPSLELDPAALDQIMRTFVPATGEYLLRVVPFYVIPSQAEINWEKRAQSC